MDFNVIQRRIEEIEKLEEENRTFKQLIKDELESDEVYMQTVSEAKEIITKKKRIKDEILSRDEMKKVTDELKDNLEEVATLKDILSTELMDHYEQSKTDEIPDLGGAPRKFKVVARLLPRGKQGFNKKEPM